MTATPDQPPADQPPRRVRRGRRGGRRAQRYYRNLAARQATEQA